MIQRIGQGGVQWLRATLNPPFAEHLSFRLGNQLFFVYVDVDALPFTGKRKSLFLGVSSEATAIPCLLRMKHIEGTYVPVRADWGLIDAVTGEAVDPPRLVSDERIEMSDWETHDFAIQIVRTCLEKQGKKVFSAQTSFHIDPSIWFEDENGPCYVVVRADRYPRKTAHRPANVEEIKQSCAAMSLIGFFASVSVASSNEPFSGDPAGVVPLYRGFGMIVSFEGLERL